MLGRDIFKEMTNDSMTNDQWLYAPARRGVYLFKKERNES
jgi:hypothetical protein